LKSLKEMLAPVREHDDHERTQRELVLGAIQSLQQGRIGTDARGMGYAHVVSGGGKLCVKV
jgi:hypothetical protein